MDLEKIKLEHEKNLLKTQVEIQEQTFENISREIHDNIGQKLSLAKLYLNTFSETCPNVSIKINDSLDLISDSIDDLRDISRSLNSDNILNNGLVKALEFEISQLMKLEKHTINYTVSGEYIFLDNKKELILFRIVQEALNNIIKHANSNRIDINLDFRKDLLILEVRDQGKGYENDQIINGKSSGIKNMIKRASMIGAEMNIKSKINEGTCVQVKVPYETTD